MAPGNVTNTLYLNNWQVLWIKVSAKCNLMFFLSQGSETLVHKLHEKQLELFMSFFACFIKGEYFTALSPRALVNLVLEDHMILPAREIYVGQDADAFRSKTPNHAVSTLQHRNH